MDFPIAFQSDQSHNKMGLFLRVSVNPLQIYCYILKANTNLFTIF